MTDQEHDPNQVTEAKAMEPGFEAKIKSGEIVPLVKEKAIVQAREAGKRFNPMDLPPEEFKQGLERRGTNRAILMKWIKDSLVENVDYGRIHVVKKDKCPYGKNCNNPDHFSKPSLFKPGAEKISGKMGVSPEWPALESYEKMALKGMQIQTIILRCYILDQNGSILGEGVGARNVAQDYGNLNNSLKMAKKSSFIDATLTMGGLSEVFTQDVEDMNFDPGSQKPKQQSTPQGKPPPQQPPQPPPQQSPPQQSYYQKKPPMENRVQTEASFIELINNECAETQEPFEMILERITAYKTTPGVQDIKKLSDGRLTTSYGIYKKSRGV